MSSRLKAYGYNVNSDLETDLQTADTRMFVLQKTGHDTQTSQPVRAMSHSTPSIDPHQREFFLGTHLGAFQRTEEVIRQKYASYEHV